MRPRLPWRRAPRGFSLLEALVALAIASIAFVALYRTVGQSAFNASALDERIQANLLARSIFASATFAEDMVRKPAGTDGDWQWTLQVVSEQTVLREVGGAQATVPVRVARVQLVVAHLGRPVLTWVGFKPYGAAP